MDFLSRSFDVVSRQVFEPALIWVINHPFISLIVVFAIVYTSVRNYRML